MSEHLSLEKIASMHNINKEQILQYLIDENILLDKYVISDKGKTLGAKYFDGWKVGRKGKWPTFGDDIIKLIKSHFSIMGSEDKKDNKYDHHFLLDTEEAKKYAVEYVKFFDSIENLECIEIGDGNINYVFKVYDKSSGKSLIIKQADKLLRSSGRPLDLHRNKIEAEILKIQKKLAPDFIPEIYSYNEDMYALAMEDISSYKNLRTELMEGKIFKNFADEITTFMVDTLLPTTDLVLDRAKKKEYVKLFINIDLCDITEDLVLTEPYYNYKNRNIIIEENLKYVEENLYNDEELHYYVDILRNNYMNNAECLLHGDLHSGSIFINEKGIKVIDPEFAFYGPMGYDIGNVIGNLVFSYMYKLYTDKGDELFLDYILITIKNIIDLTRSKLLKKYDEIVTFNLYKNERFKIHYIDSIMRDSFGYAGTEIIRRTVGDSKVAEVNKVKDIKIKVPMERNLIMIGKELIKKADSYENGESVINMIKEQSNYDKV